MIVKACTKCGKEKQEVDFYKRTNGTFHAECKQCLKKRSDKWNKENGKRRWDNRKRLFKKISDDFGFGSGIITRYGVELAQEVYKKYSGKCDTCGKEKDLTFHHIDGQGIHIYEKGGKMNNEITNIQLLCRSCHGKLHKRKNKNI